MPAPSRKGASAILAKIAEKITQEMLETQKTQWLIPNLIAQERILMFYAKAGAGKSHLLLAISKMLANDKNVKEVLYIDGDNGISTLSDRGLSNILKQTPKLEYYKADSMHRFCIFDDLAQIQNLKDSVVVIDSIRNFINCDMRDDVKVTHFLHKLQILRSKGATIIFAHHQPKQYDDVNNEIAKGSTAFVDSVDEAFFVAKFEKLGAQSDKNKIIFDVKPQKHRDATKITRLVLSLSNYDLKISDDIFVGLNEREYIMLELATEIINGNPSGINQGELGNKIRSLANKNHYDIVGNNKMLRLLFEFENKLYAVEKSVRESGGYQKIFKPLGVKKFSRQ